MSDLEALRAEVASLSERVELLDRRLAAETEVTELLSWMSGNPRCPAIVAVWRRQVMERLWCEREVVRQAEALLAQASQDGGL